MLVDRSKLRYDIEIPRLTNALVARTPDLGSLDPHALPAHRLDIAARGGIAEEPIRYRGRDMLTREVVDEAEFARDFPADAAGYLNVVARLVLRECRLANLADGFARLAPAMKRYIEDVMCAGRADMDDEAVMIALNRGDAKSLLVDVFVQAIRNLSYEERAVQPAGERLRLSETEPYPTTRPVAAASKTVFNLVPCDSTLEERFARWLDEGAPDVLAFAKNEPAVRFDVSYLGAGGGLRFYRPDFVVRTPQATYVVETKGLETLDTPRKDRRMARWCEDAARLDGREWRYLKVGESLFDGGEWDSLAALEQASAPPA